MNEPRGPRWWPAFLILVLAAVGVAAVWIRGDLTRQNLVLSTFNVLVIALLLLLIWFLLFSRLPGKVRLLGGSAAILLGVALATTVEIRGVSGDLLPVFAWRWSPDGGSLGSSGGGGVPAELLERSEGDFAQFLGPNRDARVAGVTLAEDWSGRPPREVWRRSVGEGWSGFSIIGKVAVTQEQRGDREMVTAYRLDTGEPLWDHGDGARFDTTIGGIGPRATPTLAGGRVFTVGAQGRLNALDLTTGRRLWSRDLREEYAAVIPDWGKSASPLVTGGKVIVSVGGEGQSLMAFDVETGDVVWQAGNDGVSYSSPLAATLAGVAQILIFNESSVTGHVPETGAILWRRPWAFQQPNVSQPLVMTGDRLLVSSGYGIGSKLFQFRIAGAGAATAEELAGEEAGTEEPVAGNSAAGNSERPDLEIEELWESRRLKAKFSQTVEVDGYLYGLDDGVMVCIDPATGERCWKRGRYGHGQLLLVGDLLLVLGEEGELMLIDPHPDELRELGRIQAVEGKTWNNMAFSAPYLLVRNSKEAACWELPLGPPSESPSESLPGAP